MINGLFIIITVLYIILILYLVKGLNNVKPFYLNDLPSKTKFSIVIPFKNETNNLTALVNSLEALNYPKMLFEVIFINDNSIDNSEQLLTKLANALKIETIILNNLNSSKKSALTLGISKAKYNWIITTDADCLLPKYWLDCYDELIQSSECDVVLGPVIYMRFNTFLDRFQALDILSLQATTKAAFGLDKPFLCNGANMAYKVSVFKSLNGFAGNETIASGDDIFLLEKAIKSNYNLAYLNSPKATINTNPEPSIKTLIQQRKRWAAKTSVSKLLYGKLVAFIVLLMNMLLVSGVILAITSILQWKTFFYVFFIKINIDFLLLYKCASFFDTKEPLSSYWLACIIYPFFSTYIAVTSMFTKYKWKGQYYSK